MNTPRESQEATTPGKGAIPIDSMVAHASEAERIKLGTALIQLFSKYDTFRDTGFCDTGRNGNTTPYKH